MADHSEIEGREDRKARRKRLTDRLEALRERALLIELELNNYTNDFFRACIFGSARLKPEHEAYKLTLELGRELGKMGVDVLTGGGLGLMEAANRGVQEGRAETGSKSKSFGITIDLAKIEPPSEHLDVKHHHRRFSSRLDDFMRLSNVIVVVEGGIGTMLELLYSWQLLQVGHLSDRPIILMNKEYWGGLIKWVEELAVGRGLVSPGDLRWLHLVDTVDDAVSIIGVEHQKFLDRQVAKGN